MYYACYAQQLKSANVLCSNNTSMYNNVAIKYKISLFQLFSVIMISRENSFLPLKNKENPAENNNYRFVK